MTDNMFLQKLSETVKEAANHFPVAQVRSDLYRAAEVLFKLQQLRCDLLAEARDEPDFTATVAENLMQLLDIHPDD